MTYPLSLRHPVIVSLAILTLSAFIGVGIVVDAQTNDPLANIEYPIAELGGCENEEACHLYCDEAEHLDECIAFAEAHGLLAGDDLESAKKFAAAGGEGPGGCTSRESCEAYCSDVTHIEECVAFGEEHGLIPPNELEEAKKVARALREGVELPGGCTSKDSCEAYCSEPNHIEECIAFAEAAGFMEEDELAEAKKFMEFIKEGGETPGGCRGERECRAYCEDPDHITECIDFAERIGAISTEEAEIVRKTGGVGPGGCRGREECEAYCNDPANQEACFAFAKEHGLISEEDLSHAREGFSRLRDGLEQAPPEVSACIEESVGSDILAKLETGEPFTPSPAFGEKIRHCFEELGGFGEFDGGHDGEFPDGPGGGGFDIFEDANPQVLGCLSSEIGFDRFREIRDEGIPPTPEDLAAVRRCFEQTGFETPETPEHDGSPLPGVHDGATPSPPSGFGVPTLEPGIEECVFGELGADFKERLAAGEFSPSVIEPVVRACTEAFYQSQIQSNPEQDVHETFETDASLDDGTTDDPSTHDGSLDTSETQSGVRIFLGNAWNAFLGLFR